MRFVLVFLLLICAAPAAAQPVKPSQVLDAAVNQVIRPGMANFRSRASGLESAMSALCANPSASTMGIAAQQFGLTALAYGSIELIRLGPLMEDNRAERLLSWPDQGGAGLRQVQDILAEGAESATVLLSLREMSVSVQGFGALEFVLFGTGSEQLLDAGGAFRCRFGQAVAANIRLIAEELAMGWYQYDGIAVHLTQPQPQHTDYRTETEALEALVEQLAHGIETVRDTRLTPFTAGEDGAENPHQALFWRAGLTLPMIGANLESIRRLVALSGVADMPGAADAGLAHSIDLELVNAERALALITEPVKQAMLDEEQSQALRDLLIVTQSLEAMIGDQLPTALGLSVSD